MFQDKKLFKYYFFLEKNLAYHLFNPPFPNPKISYSKLGYYMDALVVEKKIFIEAFNLFYYLTITFHLGMVWQFM